jgi:aspartyl-tRNA(Asn)/glutamyl-tRNA(Gln) amidotransferase subunit A
MSARAAVQHALDAPDLWGCVEVRLADSVNAADASDDRALRGTGVGPLDGLPFAVKSNIDVRGVPTTAGTEVPRPPAPQDADVVARLRDAGAIPVLTTTMAEAAIGSVTINPWTGSCLSPADLSRNAGGSSGGSAAAVAAGLVPFALGSDTMGSVRIPAACCGVVGWKPTAGAVESTGLVPLSRQLDTIGVLAPTALDVLSIARVLLNTESAGPLAQRIGVPRFAAQADDAAVRAVADVRDALRAQGHEVIEVDLELDAALVRRRGLLLCEAEAAQYWGGAVDGSPAGLSEHVRALLRFGRDAAADAIQAAHVVRTDVEGSVRSVLDRVDAFLLPTLPSRAPAADEDPPGLADFTAFANLAGVPAVSIPSSVVAVGERVPRSVQLIGSHGADLHILKLAASLQG